MRYAYVGLICILLGGLAGLGYAHNFKPAPIEASAVWASLTCDSFTVVRNWDDSIIVKVAAE